MYTHAYIDYSLNTGHILLHYNIHVCTICVSGHTYRHRAQIEYPRSATAYVPCEQEATVSVLSHIRHVKTFLMMKPTLNLLAYAITLPTYIHSHIYAITSPIYIHSHTYPRPVVHTFVHNIIYKVQYGLKVHFIIQIQWEFNFSFFE